ncbi:MAG: hypothetical protein J7L08_02375 [Candidatus Aenigmarchaeota archaeon]|nr:hypothetical protein [Candidatus Aenigmarchaeota archaeon]
MANLKGGTFEKQVKDAFHRLEAFGKGRHGNSDHLTHSDGLAVKREMYLSDYQKFAEDNGFTEKLNLTMNNENIERFLTQRIEGLKHSTQENYIRGLSSLIQGLQEVNISVGVDKTVFNSMTAEVKANALPDTRSGLAVANPVATLERLNEVRFESAVLAEVQCSLGVRISESFEIVKNIDGHYNESNGVIENLVGKGNHVYEPKIISSELVEKIKACEHIPSPNTYRNDLKEVGVEHSKNWRFGYAKNEFEKKIEEGIEYSQALREVSEGLNHSRESMSLFYLEKS